MCTLDWDGREVRLIAGTAMRGLSNDRRPEREAGR